MLVAEHCPRQCNEPKAEVATEKRRYAVVHLGLTYVNRGQHCDVNYSVTNSTTCTSLFRKRYKLEERHKLPEVTTESREAHVEGSQELHTLIIWEKAHHIPPRSLMKQIHFLREGRSWALHASAILGVLWTITSVVYFSLETVGDAWRYWSLAGFVILSGVSATWIVYRQLPPTSVTFTLLGSQNEITVQHGNIWDSTYDDRVRIFAGDCPNFFERHDTPATVGYGFVEHFHDSDLEAAKKDVEQLFQEEESDGSENYPVTGIFEKDKKRFVLFKLTRRGENPIGSDVVESLKRVWKRRIFTTRRVCLPLVGGGGAGLTLPPRYILDLVIQSIYLSSTDLNRTLARDITIVLYGKKATEAIDLRQVQEYWTA